MQNPVLKEYYVRYLTDVRNLSQSSVKHYIDALNNISRYLVSKNLLKPLSKAPISLLL